jgi:transcriptional regulator with PAS, ATPase and Fis domain
MLENKSYLPIIRDLTEKLNEQDTEVRILSSLLKQLRFTMLIIDSRGNVIYSNKKEINYSGMKCWELFGNRTGQCRDCYFNPLGTSNAIAASIKRYPACDGLQEHIIICHPVRDNGHSFMLQFIIELSDGHIRQQIKDSLINCIQSI